jgi:hypothetical protein
MNEGVQILLERMKTHPEEFVAEAQYGISKWSQAIQHFQEYLSKEDKEALDVAWKQTISDEMQRRFTQAVMEELIDPKSQTPSDIELKRGMLSGGQTQGQLWAQSQLQQAQATQAHIQLHQQQLAIQAQAAQQQPGSFTNMVGSAGQGLLGTLFGGNK